MGRRLDPSADWGLHGVDEIVASGQSEPDETPFRGVLYLLVMYWINSK